MSISVMNYVWDNSEQTGTALLMLIAIADHANEDGICWPSIARLAKRARVSERQAQYIIKKLAESGELEIQRGQGRGNTSLYIINIEKGAADCTISETEKVQPIAPNRTKKGAIQREKVQSSVGKGAADCTQNHQEPSIEPSREGKGRKSAPITGPACTIYRDVFRSNPTKAQAPIIEARVSDLEVWRAACEAWALKRYNPGNVAGILDWYENPDRIAAASGPPAHGSGKPSNAMHNMIASAELLQEFRSAK